MTSPRASASKEAARSARVAELRELGLSGIPELIEELDEPSWPVRRAVVAALADARAAATPLLCQALSKQRDNEARVAGLVDALCTSKNHVDGAVLELLSDPNVAVVCDGVHILGRRESKNAVPALVRLLNHQDDNVALAAIVALGRVGGPAALDSLLTLVESGNFFRTFPAIDVLGRARDPRVLQSLLRLLRDPLYGAEAARALGRVGDISAVPALVDQLCRAGDGLASAVAAAILAIHAHYEQRFGTGLAVERMLLASHRAAELGDRLTAGLKHADASEQLALSALLGWIGEEGSVHALLALLSAPPAVAEVAAASIKKLGALAEPHLLEAVRVSGSAQRRLLIPILSGRRASKAVLITCLADEDSTVRALACDALARTSDSSAVPAIFPLLSDPDARVAQAALGAVQSLGSDETKRLTLTLAAADSADPRARRAALRIIGYFGYPEGLEALTVAVHGHDEAAREAALTSLPFVDHVNARALLLEAAMHPSARTRGAALRALGHCQGDPEILQKARAALSDSEPWVRYYACQALGRLRDDEATEAIAGLLEDGSGQVRVAAVDALAHLRGPQAFSVLSRVVGSADADLHRAGLLALGISKRPEALPMLLEALQSTTATTRLVALSALAELGLDEIAPALAARVHDSDEGVRVAALGFLARRTDAATTMELLTLLRRDPERQLLVEALAWPAPGRTEALARALTEADDALASGLVASLSRNGSDEARAALRAAFGTSHDPARRAAAAALIAMQDSVSAPRLAASASNDPDAEVRRICTALLRVHSNERR